MKHSGTGERSRRRHVRHCRENQATAESARHTTCEALIEQSASRDMRRIRLARARRPRKFSAAARRLLSARKHPLACPSLSLSRSRETTRGGAARRVSFNFEANQRRGERAFSSPL